jgi:phosphatidylglycerophosphate synthase
VIANTRLTVGIVLMVIALLFVILAAIGKAPLWPAVLCVVLEGLVRLVPLND